MIKIYDSKLKRKIEFKPLVEAQVSMYVCGPTVYDVAHLGHGRSAVCFDVIRKYFEYSGHKVKFVFNYTDVDDKIIDRANKEGISCDELIKRVMPEYDRDYLALGVKEPSVKPKPTEHIPEMVELIKRLEDGGYMYVIDGDGVYFDVTKFEKYGELSGQKLEDLKAGARVEVKEGKRNSYDFVLWKFKKEGEPSWDSPWGEGRPGWHIECSAMSHKHLGEKFDIHGGGLDLKFPHHECEIAQAEGGYGAGNFAQHWIHNGFITVDDEKMSKSLGNFFTLKEIFEKYDPKVVRFMFLQTHYRNPINFSDKLLEQSKAGLERLHDFVRYLRSTGEGVDDVGKLVAEARKGFGSSMRDDFDTSGALGSIFELVKAVHLIGNVGKKGAETILKFFEEVDEVFGVLLFKEEKADEGVEKSIKERDEARKAKDFGRADSIRYELLKKGIELEDTSSGTLWKRV
ncbi:MAG: cysteine--tRNA ligase [Candidatus Peregrinibacteria bacterium]